MRKTQETYKGNLVASLIVQALADDSFIVE